MDRIELRLVRPHEEAIRMVITADSALPELCEFMTRFLRAVGYCIKYSETLELQDSEDLEDTRLHDQEVS